MTSEELLRSHASELGARLGLEVEVVTEGDRLFILVRQAPLPPGRFRLERSDVLLITDRQYPLSAMDMFWVEVGVLRRDGSIPRSAEAIEQYLGRSWRRFSWHRNSVWSSKGNPLLDHYAFVEQRWAVETA